MQCARFSAHDLVCTVYCERFSVNDLVSLAPMAILNSYVDTRITSATWMYRKQDLKEKNDSIGQLMTRLFVEQPRLHWFC